MSKENSSNAWRSGTAVAVFAVAGSALVFPQASEGAVFPRIFRDGLEPAVTVLAIQTGMVNGAVFLRGRAVTALTSDRKHLWIADDLAAAPYSGVYVDRGASAEPLDGIDIGARVTFDGVATELAGLTGILASDIALHAAPGVAPVPVDVTIDAVKPDVAGEDYEGVLVQLSMVRVTSVDPIAGVTIADSSGQTLVLRGQAGGLSPPPVLDTCYATIAGVMHVDSPTGERVLLPRGPEDFLQGFDCP